VSSLVWCHTWVGDLRDGSSLLLTLLLSPPFLSALCRPLDRRSSCMDVRWSVGQIPYKSIPAPCFFGAFLSGAFRRLKIALRRCQQITPLRIDAATCSVRALFSLFFFFPLAFLFFPLWTFSLFRRLVHTFQMRQKAFENQVRGHVILLPPLLLSGSPTSVLVSRSRWKRLLGRSLISYGTFFLMLFSPFAVWLIAQN